ncbi:AIPR family protein [Streptomyces sp. NPDC056296]|uniref:AIPR family protein n=1 Tax=Streptomyces sp. NPDC056296 TaxID=3345775 RepID=UPI0035E3882C
MNVDDAADAMPVQMRQVRNYLTQTFAPLIDTGDVAHVSTHVRDRVLLSRALAAQAVVIVTGCNSEEAAAAVTDGADDYGIDAVAFSANGSEIWFIQAKWSDRGRASLTEHNALQLVAGLQRLARHRYSGNNSRINRLLDRIDDALGSPLSTVHLVAAIAGDGYLTEEAEERLVQVGQDFGFDGRTRVQVHTLGLADFYSAAQLRETPMPVDITATFPQGWHAIGTPYQAYQGAVSAGEVSAWYETHRTLLLPPSLRQYGADRINQSLLTQLLTEPDLFWYFNNGVTVLCDSIEVQYFARRAQGQPVRLQMKNARVISGAETVASIAHAVSQRVEVADEAMVSLRIICVGDASQDLVTRLTHTSGDERKTDPLNMVALDPKQLRIRDEFATKLSKHYVFKRGAIAPVPSAGCSVQEAALALVCAHPDTSLVVRTSADTDFLWRSSPNGAYNRLFGSPPSSQQIWQSVLILRQVQTALAKVGSTQSVIPWVREVIEHGELLAAHLVFQTIGPETLEEWEPNAGEREAWVEEWTKETALLLASSVEHLYGRSVFLASVFTDEHKCRRLVEAVVRGLSSGNELVIRSTRTRRRSSVSILVDHGRIAEGTRLVYRPSNPIEERAIGDWLSEDPTRYLATWTNDRRRPLIWEVDQRAYSPTGLVMRIWREAKWAESPAAVRGPACWTVPGDGTLAEIAERLTAVLRHNGDD